jgi:hypothetical protein
MIRVTACEWDGRQWNIRADVDEGVYHRRAYPVTLTYLGPIPPGADAPVLRAALESVMLDVIRMHLKKGALHPAGMLVNWRFLVDGAFSGDGLDDTRAQAHLLDSRIGPVFRGEGHGYYHPFPSVPGSVPAAS